MADLTKGRITAEHLCHLDPDLAASSLPNRSANWRGSLGQVAQSQKHLENQGVGSGDLFIFWGLFRSVERRDGRWHYTGRSLHAAFGWLQIEEVLKYPGSGSVVNHPWLSDHPHAQDGWGVDNTIYIASHTLNGLGIDAPGYGMFQRAMKLTSPDATSPSRWQVPPWLHPASGGTGMTYHPPPRWQPDGGLHSAARGQEFVADIGKRADARAWVADLIEGPPMRLWRYVIVHDAGSAPNYEPPYLTLAICKPRIRLGAQPGDFVLSFAGQPLSPDPNRVVWGGVVSERVSFQEYWIDPRFAGKRPSASMVPDNIYEPGPFGLVQVENRIHDQSHVARDVNGHWVLIFEPAWRLDPEVASLPKHFADLYLPQNARRGHRVSELDDGVAAELSAWCAAHTVRLAKLPQGDKRCG